MDLKTFVKSLPDEGAREAFASRCGVALGHIRNVMYGTRDCSAELAVAIERESGGAMSRTSLYSGDARNVWPELVA